MVVPSETLEQVMSRPVKQNVQQKKQSSSTVAPRARHRRSRTRVKVRSDQEVKRDRAESDDDDGDSSKLVCTDEINLSGIRKTHELLPLKRWA